jgi:hypothetical protein
LWLAVVSFSLARTRKAEVGEDDVEAWDYEEY